MARLIVESGGERREYAVDREVVLGRLKTCAVVLDEKTISREHIKVFRDGARYIVQDLDSRSGSFLNGRRLLKSETLSNGDTIRLGPFTLRFLFDESEGSTAGMGRTTNSDTPVAARARPRTAEEVAAARPPSEALRFVLYVFLLVVLGGVTWGSRIGFGWFLDRVTG